MKKVSSLMLLLMFLLSSCGKDEEVAPKQAYVGFSASRMDKGKANERVSDNFELSHFLMKVDDQYYESSRMDQRFAFDFNTRYVVNKFDVFDTHGNLVYDILTEVPFEIESNPSTIITIAVKRPELEAGDQTSILFAIHVDHVTIPLKLLYDDRIVTGSLVDIMMSPDDESEHTGIQIRVDDEITIPVPSEGNLVDVDFYYESSDGNRWLERHQFTREEVITMRSLTVDFVTPF